MNPRWAALTVWGVVNAVNVLQSAGFLSRIRTGDMRINHKLGYGIIALALPTIAALVGYARERSDWLYVLGPAVYLAFVAFEIYVDYTAPIEFRTPPRYGILVPYLVLFFGSIVLMGVPMYVLNRPLWLVTVASSMLLLVSMSLAMRRGVG